MKYQKELNLSVGLCRHSLATNSFICLNLSYQANQFGSLGMIFVLLICAKILILYKSSNVCKPSVN